MYIVELHFHGIGKSVARIPEERVLTVIYRLSRRQRNKFQYFKVKFYRVLDRFCSFKFAGKYVVSQRHLVDVEREFRQIYREFAEARDEAYREIVDKWDEIASRLKKYAEQFHIPEDKVDSLRPTSPSDFLEMNYSITPLPMLLEQAFNAAEELMKLGEKVEEYKAIAERVRLEAEEAKRQIAERYEEKIRELNDTISKLKEALKKKSREVYRLRLKAREIAEDAKEMAPLISEETVDDLRAKLESIREFLVDGQEQTLILQ